MTRLTILITAVGMAALAAVAVFLLFREEAPTSPAAVAIGGADIGGPFELTTHEGKRITSDELIDGPTMLYFGYTFCPDVCPVDASIMADAVDILAERDIPVQPVFVTVDPARDTPEALGEFVEAMHPRMIGLTGSDDDIKAAAEAYKVYYARAGDEDDPNYLMNHTAFVYLVDQDGLKGLYRRGFPAEEIANAAADALGR